MGTKGFVGFGFGPIQSGLMLLEAQASGNFDSFCIAEIDAATVEAVRRAGCRTTVNVAERNGVRRRVLEGFEILNPAEEEDRTRLVAAVVGADEIATAIPSVDYYDSGGRSSVAGILAEGLEEGKTRIIYACENHNYAAEMLREKISLRSGGEMSGGAHLLNTVIGKMSGSVSREDIARLGLEPMTPGSERAILVEEFNRILISRCPPGYERGITVFEEREDLLPFEEAKLYGHNAVHSLLGYLAQLQGYEVMSEIRGNSALMDLGRRAFVDESGAAMLARHASIDELFTPAGYRAYAEDLLERMTNPYLHDAVSRICRDPARKLGFDDRIFGTMRRALDCGVTPRLMALAGAAALRYAAAGGEPWVRADRGIAATLTELWGGETDEAGAECVQLVIEADRLLEQGRYL